MKKSISFIYFDVGGVFLDWREGQRRAAKKYGVPVEDIFAVFSENWQAACRGTLSAEDYMAMFAKLFKMAPPHPHLSDFWTDYYKRISRMHAFAKSLVGRYSLGLLTNAEKGAMQHAIQKGLLPDIRWDAIVDSSEHGTIKPEARIYEIAETLADVSPKEILFIDDVPAHIEAARSRGWQGIVFDTSSITESISQIRHYLQGESS